MENIIGKRLKAARLQAGMTQTQLGDRMGFNDRQTVAAIEAGKRKLAAEELLTAMNALGRDLEYFTDPLRLEGEASFSWRTDTADSNVVNEFESWAKNCLALYRYVADEEDVWTAPVRLELTKKSSYEDAHRAAEWLASEWNLGDVPADTLEAAIGESLRVLVLHIDAPEGISGAAVKLPELSAILINRNEPVGRRNFDLAHELFHLLTWETIPPDHSVSCDWDTSKKRGEQLANNFAGALLMPEDKLRMWWEQAPLDNRSRWLSWLDDSARRLRVSTVALQWRLVQLDLMEKDAVDDSLCWSTSNGAADEKPRRFNRNFAEALGKGIDSGRVSIRRAAAQVDLTVDGLADLFSEHSLEVPFDI